ncbi:MAG: hypothetical protein IME93_00255 [Proteobacteria bacterium]|nr:hypothetical protein [Pseudomonadota bacterium]
MKIITVILLVLPNSIFASGLPESFSKLEEMYIDGVSIAYNKKITTVINERSEDGMSVRAIRTLIDWKKKGQYYVIDFSEGPSADPHFTIYKEVNKKLKRITAGGGTQLIVPGNGSIYVSGHTNSMFDERLKIKIDDEKYKLVKQPYLFVGLDTEVSRDIEIYSEKEQKNVVARLPEGSSVFVVLNDGKYYLLKTPFGLLGWYYMDGTYPVGTKEVSPLPGIYYHGD